MDLMMDDPFNSNNNFKSASYTRTAIAIARKKKKI